MDSTRRRRRQGSRTAVAAQVERLEPRALLSADMRVGLAKLVAAAEVSRATQDHGRSAVPGPRVYSNLVYTSRGGTTEHLDLYLPAGKAPASGWPVILGLPGGGWRWVRRSDMGRQVSVFTQYGYAVAVADYAYAANKPGGRVWPADFTDVQLAVEWLRSKAGRFSLDPSRVVAFGQSAGSHLAALLGTDAAPAARVQAVVDFYGPTDLTALYQTAPKTRPYLVTFLGGTPDHVPGTYQDASPVNHVAPGDPPFLIYQGEADTAVPPAQSAELATALEAAGVPYQAEYFAGAEHGFWVQEGPTGDLTSQILAFLDAALNHHGQGIGTLGF